MLKVKIINQSDDHELCDVYALSLVESGQVAQLLAVLPPRGQHSCMLPDGFQLLIERTSEDGAVLRVKASE